MSETDTLGAHYLEVVRHLFAKTKARAERAVAQLDDVELHAEPTPGSNSVSVMMRHIAGNQRSRWTDFLTSDGEKSWRQRDTEFEDGVRTREEIEAHWEEGWSTLFAALNVLMPDDLLKEVHIRGRGCTVVEAIERQVAHYETHVGQIVYVARMLKGDAWQTLSIPRGESETYDRGLGFDATEGGAASRA